VCRLALDPATGQLRHQAQVGMAIRGALFLELILDGRLTGKKYPCAVGPSETDGRLADSLHRAVAGRQPLQWRRWFGHTKADTEAAVGRLVSGGVWRQDGSRLAETDPGRLLGAHEHVSGLLAVHSGAAPLEDVAVALLSSGAGLAGSRPRPRAQLSRMREMMPLLPEALAERELARAAVRASLVAIRRRAGARFLSG
jgi:hypothetical protein